jgi:hypothetical protein
MTTRFRAVPRYLTLRHGDWQSVEQIPSAALLAVTGNGGLAMPPVKAVNCAPPGSRVLGPQGAQFTAALPQRTVLLASAYVCSYMFRAGNGTAFTVEAMLGSGPITFGSVADWTDHGAVRRVTRSGTSGVEAIHCDSVLHGCRERFNSRGAMRSGRHSGVVTQRACRR